MRKFLGYGLVAFAGVLAISGATVLVLNAVYDIPETAAPANPASGFERYYADSTSHQLTCLTHTGTSCLPSGGGGGGFIQTLTAPVAASFTQQNYSAGGTTTTQSNNTTPVTSINIGQFDSAGTEEIVGLSKAIINAAFTVTIGFTFAGDIDTEPFVGLWLLDSTPANNIIWGYYGGNTAMTAGLFSNLTGSFSGFIYNVSTAPWNSGPLQWFRIQETASARNYSNSSDGVHFNLVFTESNTAHFTTASYGLGVTSRSSHASGGGHSVTLYSFTETTP